MIRVADTDEGPCVDALKEHEVFITGDLATEKPFLITNPGNKDPRDKKSRCVSVEKALPVCPALTR